MSSTPVEKRPHKKGRIYGARFKARRRAVDILFEAEARDIDPVAIVEDRVELARRSDAPVAPIADYTRDIVSGVAVEIDRIDDAIEAALAEDWELHRIPAVDRAIMRVSTWELLFNPEVPKPTAVVEGVELASQYADQKASAYINALLDEISRRADELRAEFAREDRVETFNPSTDEPQPSVDEAKPEET
ncbi:transcription antitermination factor NusB [Corynebacterium poyangense]|uniref:transcription antitermination factor NusB n=1 Tax=Corynebacterium poyangense TaxID=2684405 RepID=UPI001CD03F20|nr:transcription antitermination factor NusB [Corynebacterium poyangense]